MKELNFDLTDEQIAWLAMIFDEDFNEEITYNEYIDTLDAFGALTEEDQAQDVAFPRISISKRAMFKMIDALALRGL